LHISRAHQHAKQFSRACFQAIGAIDKLLLAVKEVVKDHQSRLGDDREIHTLNAVPENQIPNQPSDNGWNQPDKYQCGNWRPEWLPKEWELVNPIVFKEFGDTVATGLALGVEHQIHRCGIAAQRKEDALAKAEKSGVTPNQIDRQSRDGQGKVATEEVEPEIIQDHWQNEKGKRQQDPGKESSEEFQDRKQRMG
jgi:hypothetical protein